MLVAHSVWLSSDACRQPFWYQNLRLGSILLKPRVLPQQLQFQAGDNTPSCMTVLFWQSAVHEQPCWQAISVVDMQECTVAGLAALLAATAAPTYFLHNRPLLPATPTTSIAADIGP